MFSTRKSVLSLSLVTSAVALCAFSTGCRMQGTGAPVPGDVLTYHNDFARDGQNNYETTLTPSNVAPNTFGKLAGLPVDGQIYAQPLFAKGMSAGGATRDLVFVATENDSLYAFDANTLSPTPVWKRTFTGDSVLACSKCTTLGLPDTQVPNVWPTVGITATPVIDTVSNTIYVVAQTKENGTFFWKLHALDLGTGAELPGSPLVITGQIKNSTAPDAVKGVLTFNPGMQLSRSALVYQNGTLFIASTSFDDREPVHGWLFAYDTMSLTQTGVWNTTPNTGLGTIWMAGGAIASDASGNFYLASGNGDPALVGRDDYSNALLKLTYSGGTFNVADWFRPYDYNWQSDNDVEIGSGGVMLLPDQPGKHPHLLIQGGKEGTLYLVNRDNMGHFDENPDAIGDTNIVEELIGVVPGGSDGGPGIYSTPAYWQGHILLAGSGDHLRSFPMVNGLIDLTHETQANETIARRGATVSISSNGNSNGIAWLIDASNYTYTWDGNTIVITSHGPAVLYAYNPSNLSAPLYSSAMESQDTAGEAVKFTVPTVAGGKVFVPTYNELSIYGLRPKPLNTVLLHLPTAPLLVNKPIIGPGPIELIDEQIGLKNGSTLFIK